MKRCKSLQAGRIALMSLQHTEATEIDDYSGPFEPDLRLDDFSKEGLKKLVEVGGAIYGAVNNTWYAAVAEKFGREVADELHHEVWFKDGGVGDVENYTISRLMNFENEDEATSRSRSGSASRPWPRG